MKNEDILSALSEIDPEMLRDCAAMRKAQAKRTHPGVFLLVAASILIAGIAAVFFSVRYRGRMTANMPEESGASLTSKNTETEAENVPVLQGEGLIFEKEITMSIPDDGILSDSTAVFYFSNEMNAALEIVGYDGFRNKSNDSENLRCGYQFETPVRQDNGPYHYSRYTFRDNTRGSISVKVGEDSVRLEVNLDTNNGGYTEGTRLDFCLESTRKVASDEGEKPVVIHFVLNLEAPEKPGSIICFHREIPVLLEDDGKIHVDSTLPYTDAVVDFMNRIKTASVESFSVGSGAVDPLNYGGGKYLFYAEEINILGVEARFSDTEGTNLSKRVLLQSRGGDGRVELFFGESFIHASGDLTVSPEDYDPDGMLRIEFAFRNDAENAVLFTLDILPRKQEDLKEEKPSGFGTETAEGVPPAVSDFMKNSKDKIISILAAEGHGAPADPEEIYVTEPFVVSESSELTEGRTTVRSGVQSDYYYPVISGGHLYSILKCSIPETTDFSQFLQTYPRNMITLEEDRNMLWYLGKADNEEMLFAGEGDRYRIFHHFGFDYSHYYDVVPLYYSDGTTAKVFMDLTED